MKLGLAVLSLFAVFYEGFSCSCFQKRLEEKFCEANFVVGATVANKIESKDYYQYVVNVFQVYRTNNGVHMKIGEESIFTRSSTAACGVTNLQKDKSYIIAGGYDKKLKQFQLQSCLAIVQEVETPPEDVTQDGGKGKREPKYIPIPIISEYGTYPTVLMCLLGKPKPCTVNGNTQC